MKITAWAAPSRTLPRADVRRFYGAELGETHAFLFTTASLEVPAHRGEPSLKLVLDGMEEYRIGRRTLRLVPGTLLFLNADETYASRIDRPTRSLSLFFSRGQVAETLSSLVEVAPADLPQVPLPATPGQWREVHALANALAGTRPVLADERADELLAGVFARLLGCAPPAALRDLRRATRDELLGRLLRARNYMRDMQGEHCSLERLAEVACLSKFHFLRRFRQAFGISPAAYARRQRLDLAVCAITRGRSEDAAAAAAGYANRHSLRRARRRANGSAGPDCQRY